MVKEVSWRLMKTEGAYSNRGQVIPDRVKAFFREEIPDLKEGRILVALSGGPDSVCLLHVLHTLGYRLLAAHVNYSLRPEADAEERLVRDLCNQLGVRLEVLRSDRAAVEARQGSTQMAARDIRYDFFRELMAGEGIDWCATAHHQDDQVETILLSLLRGGAPGVLSAIPASNGGFIRPLLQVKKEDIRRYLADHELPFALDSSNQKRDYLRNQVRLDLLPLMREINPSIEDRLLRLQRELADRDKYLKDSLASHPAIQQLEKGVWRLENRPEISSEIRAILFELLLSKAGFTGTEIASAKTLLNSQSGKEMVFGGRKVVRDQKGWLIRGGDIRNGRGERNSIRPSEISFASIASGGSDFDVGAWSLRLEFRPYVRDQELPSGEDLFCMDADKVRFPIRARGWQEGDRMQPLGMNGRKKLSDIFIDLKVPRSEKARQLVLEDGERILLCSGFRIEEGVKVGKQTTTLLLVQIKKIDFQTGNDDVQVP